jgi:Fe-S oxidoreductase
VTTHFSYPEDSDDFAHVSNRCVGIGKCRRLDGGTMCPSFMVTREEKHSTRGRARMLFEMMQGDPVDRGWRDENVLDSLELCLSCKGCKSDCPVSVDMATYKAEFLSHYYQGRLRPRVAYAMGLIHRWARLASLVPNVANLVTHAPGVSTAAKLLGGIAPQHDVPAFASETFRAWFASRGPVNTHGSPVMLWIDTFNNYFHVEVAKAAVAVLEDAGYRVELPPRPLCCGRPLYDYGMLDTAAALLRRDLERLRPTIIAGIPVVGIEPSCVAVFRDEMTKLLPHDQDAGRLQHQVLTLAEFLVERADYHPPRVERRALVHGHCHHGAVMGFDADHELMARMGLDFGYSDAGCCGVAGSFGFEAGVKHDVSVKAGERKLAPLVRDASRDTLLIADGFSCKTQIEQLTGRRALHTAQVIKLALDGTVPDDFPERAAPDIAEGRKWTRMERGLLAAAAAASLFVAVRSASR